MKHNVGDIRKKLLALGFDISDERIRSYEKLGLYKSRRNADNNYREYADESVKHIIKKIILIELGVSIDTLLANDEDMIKYRVGKIKIAIDTLLIEPAR